MRKTIVRMVLAAALGFAVLLGLRMGYGYLASPNHPASTRLDDDETYDRATSFDTEKRNYASEKTTRQTSTGAAAIDQKYESVADMHAVAKDFDAAEKDLRAATTAAGGIVQLERQSGLHGNRVLQLAIGVAPERFDAFVATVRAIGTSTFVTVDKQDRTNAFKELAAKRAVLESTRDALIALKARNGSLEELGALEDRILAVHQEIQSLGISLGEYDEVNALCTVKVVLSERSTVTIAAFSISRWQRLQTAFAWAVPVYVKLLGALLSICLLAILGLILTARIPALQRLVASVPAARTDQD